jgi:hypothetical protein
MSVPLDVELIAGGPWLTVRIGAERYTSKYDVVGHYGVRSYQIRLPTGEVLS